MAITISGDTPNFSAATITALTLGSTGIAFSNGSTQTVGALGDGQTWQDVTASRTVGTTYTNSTGKPIYLYAVSSSSAWGITINGTALVAGGTYTSQVVAALVIPSGATYALSTGTLGKWLELR